MYTPTRMLPPLATARELAGASSASAAEEHLVCGKLRFFHYACDRHDDCGWGCGYRTVQSQLSWLAPDTAPPSIPELQQVLGVGAREWIGVPDAVTLLDALHGAAVEVLPLASGLALASEWRRLAAHFDAGGGPVMVGGGGDVYSKTVIGVRGGAAGEPELLILDPHFMDAAALHASDLGAVRAAGWIAWRPSGAALPSASFYNLGMVRRPADGAVRRRSVTAPPATSEPAGGWSIEVVASGEEMS